MAIDLKPHQFEVGDRVCLSRAFLQSTSQFTGDAPFDVGTVVSTEPLHGDRQYVKITWDLRGPGTSLNTNLILNDRKHLEPA